MTQLLVQENKETRKQAQREREKDREREVMALRKSLREEIRKIEGIDELAESYGAGTSAFGLPVSTKVYETNAGKLGLLSDEEIDAIVEYYARVETIQDLMELQARADTSLYKDAVKEYFDSFDTLFNFVLRRVSFGYLGDNKMREREQLISEQLQELHEAQNSAVTAIENHLEESQHE
ncbi:hypothetical protein [Halosimplex sp. TS25]|uniref:hypothetical protein n=1 Tax=Halosimplex rarum TaxID=3396619 RepID=UPI0039EADCF7